MRDRETHTFKHTQTHNRTHRVAGADAGDVGHDRVDAKGLLEAVLGIRQLCEVVGRDVGAVAEHALDLHLELLLDLVF